MKRRNKLTCVLLSTIVVFAGMVVGIIGWLAILKPAIDRTMEKTMRSGVSPCVVIFEDLNGDGHHDAAEPSLSPLPGAEIIVDDPSGKNSGRFALSDCVLRPGPGQPQTIHLTVILPPDYTPTTSLQQDVKVYAMFPYPAAYVGVLPLGAGRPTPSLTPEMSGSMMATFPVQPIQTPTPSAIGTWETVIDGVIYDNAVGPGEPVVGASVTYTVIHSYFAELQAGRLNQALTDEQGKFSLPVIVHDTDSIQLAVAASGFVTYEERLVGVDLVAGRSFSIGLTRVVTVTVSPP